jgi:uncharacterized membrane protein
MEHALDALKVIFVSALPVAELRVGLPLALILGFSKRWALFYGVLGNTLGLYMAFFVLDHLMPYLKQIKFFRMLYLRSTRKARRSRQRYMRLRYFALFLLVAIPLPGTGAWTAALVSYLFRFERSRAKVVIFFGILAVAVIMLTVGVITRHGLELLR